MFFDSSCNPDEVVQSHSPLLKAIHPRLEPASAPTSLVQFDENVDDYHLVSLPQVFRYAKILGPDNTVGYSLGPSITRVRSCNAT